MKFRVETQGLKPFRGKLQRLAQGLAADRVAVREHERPAARQHRFVTSQPPEQPVEVGRRNLRHQSPDPRIPRRGETRTPRLPILGAGRLRRGPANGVRAETLQGEAKFRQSLGFRGGGAEQQLPAIIVQDMEPAQPGLAGAFPHRQRQQIITGRRRCRIQHLMRQGTIRQSRAGGEHEQVVAPGSILQVRVGGQRAIGGRSQPVHSRQDGVRRRHLSVNG